jgi:hypothetical protein
MRSSMARRAGRPRKDGPRQPNGKLCPHRPGIGRGHDLTLAHRAIIIAGADPSDSRAGYPLGILLLRGDVDDCEHEAGLIYAGLYAAVHGASKTPRSHLASVVTGICESSSGLSDDDRDTIARRRRHQLRKAVDLVLGYGGPRALHVLENTVVFEQGLRFMDTSSRRPPSASEADRRDVASLHLALGALVREYKLAPRRSA